MSLVLAVAALAALPFQAPAQAPQTDTTFAVAQGSRLELSNAGGDVIVRAWDRNQVRVQASHSRRTRVSIEQRGAVVEIESSGSMGPGSMVDYQITVPVWMGLELGGMYAYVDIEGVRGAVTVETLEGDISVKGPAERVKVSTTTGSISVEGARGRVDASSTSQSIRIADVQGDVYVEGLSGNILLHGIRARTVEAETLSGNVTYEGTIADGGRYTFLTHSGTISFSVSESTNATIGTAVGSGSVNATFSLPTSERPGRRRQSFRLGTGSAVVEAETFSGSVRMYRPAELQARIQQNEERARERARERVNAKEKGKPEHDAWHQDAQDLHFDIRS